MQFYIFQPDSLIGRLLKRFEQEQDQVQPPTESNFDHVAAIAGQYGYAPDSEEVQALTTSTPLAVKALLSTAFSEEERWHSAFNPADSQHVEYRNGTLVILKYPHVLSRPVRNFGAARADIVRARLAEGWEELCDRIVIDSHETTFFEGDVPVVIFCGSGRDDWGRVMNATDALKTHAGIVIDEADVFVENDSFQRMPDLVIKKVDGTWTWPTRQAA